MCDPNLIANDFNDYFVNIGPNLAKKFNRDSDRFFKFLTGSYNDSMFLYDTSYDEVHKVKTKTSCGIDEISSKVIKRVAPYISVPLSYIFNLGVDHLIFDGGVVQIPKKISSICFWLKKNFLQNS